MYETKEFSLPTRTEMFFNFILQFYPKSYRRRFGQEMLFAFENLYEEELIKAGKVGFSFWLSQIGDIIRSIIEQHIDEVNKKGMKKYLQQMLHINKYNVIGGVLLLPAFIVFLIDVVARIAQGDLVHYNRPVYIFMSHTILYWQPILFIWVIIFPIMAIIINSVPLLKNSIKKHNKLKTRKFLMQNLITILLLGFATFFILLIKFHDFAPCMFHGIARLGFEHFSHIVAVCRNA